MKHAVYTYEMTNARYVNIISGIIKVTNVIFIKVANDIKSVGRQPPLCVSDGYFNNLMALR
jgi:hypothetical protein